MTKSQFICVTVMTAEWDKIITLLNHKIAENFAAVELLQAQSEFYKGRTPDG